MEIQTRPRLDNVRNVIVAQESDAFDSSVNETQAYENQENEYYDSGDSSGENESGESEISEEK